MGVRLGLLVGFLCLFYGLSHCWGTRDLDPSPSQRTVLVPVALGSLSTPWLIPGLAWSLTDRFFLVPTVVVVGFGSFFLLVFLLFAKPIASLSVLGQSLFGSCVPVTWILVLLSFE